MNKFYALICACVLLLSSCGGGDNFTVFVSVDGLGTQNVRAVYYSGDKVNVVTSMALDGKFQFSGVSESPVLIDLYTGSRALMGHVIARNGESVELGLKLNEPGVMTAKGDRLSEMMAKFVTSNSAALNSGDTAVLNDAVISYIEKNSKSDLLPYLVVSFFDPSVSSVRADSVVALVDDGSPEVSEMLAGYRELLMSSADSVHDFGSVSLFTCGDSVTTITPNGNKGILMAFSAVSDATAHEALLKELNEIYDSLKSRARVVEVSVVADTAAWKAQVGDVKPRYTRCWAPGGVSSPGLMQFDIKRIPWYVAADSVGEVVYSGDDLKRAVTYF